MSFASLFRRFSPLVTCALLAVTAAACSDTTSPTEPSGTAPFSQTDLRVGAGAAAALGDTLTVNYTGWLYDATKPDQKGLQFDSSQGRDPFPFRLGAGQVILGWDAGLVGQRVGGLRRLVIPPSLGYGGFRRGVIPPHATLVFEVELLSVTPAGS
ncbi:MAG TPA: FKBP-type peptidyl-prolyl cis-trans isomerase [Vicinamibacterales bacterium]|nr:FKBP-type peptidyl-prolyl cis-trans isomerase [Vicinamibacterales bacterium]